MKSFNKAVKTLTKKLQQENPEKFSSSWIFKNAQPVYHFIRLNFKTENGDIDWDILTQALPKTFQKRWIRYKRKNVKQYEKQSEVDIILDRYRDKLYTFITQIDEKDKKIQHKMLISLVRIGQKGNVCAQQELIKWVTYITDDWIDRYPKLYRWKGYEDEVSDKIKTCIRLYRYTGTFLGYLYKTLEYSALGKPPLCSLNDKMFYGEKTLEEFAIVEEDWQIYK